MKFLAFSPKLLRAVTSLTLALCAAGTLAQVASLDSLTSFGERSRRDGLVPYSPLLFDAPGNLYGTTFGGGLSGYGLVFEMLKKEDGSWTRKTIFEFSSFLDGNGPSGPLTMDSEGRLYGTTRDAGKNSAGVVFQLSQTETGRWREKVLFHFPANPKGTRSRVSGVIRDRAGNLFVGISTAAHGGTGTILQIAPTIDNRWVTTAICGFDSTQGGPTALTIDGTGDLYGVTENALQGGVVFHLAHPAAGEHGWTYTTLHTFRNHGTDGRQANSIILDSEGTLYGTTGTGGAYDSGTVFEIPAGQPADGPDKILYNFNRYTYGGADYPIGVTLGPSGNLVGVSEFGGFAGGGTVGKSLELSPQEDGSWKVRALHNFGSYAVCCTTDGDYKYLDGTNPTAPLVLGPDGNFYGVTEMGGYADAQAGTVFKLTIH